VVGDGFSAKDFRTWRATVTAAQALRGRDRPGTERDQAHARKLASEAAAEQLGNTPTVARNAYIDPRVFEVYADGELTDAHGAVEPVVLEALAPSS
jgi:DNA topoisomerase IB